MDFTIVFMAFSMFWKLTSSIRCYKCEPERKFDGTQDLTCENFNENSSYEVDCPYSTMCLKKETLLDSLGVSTKSFQRGCAPQTIDGEQQKVGRHYQHVKNIHEVYNEGCEQDYNGEKITKTTHCYCRGHLCNKGHALGHSIVNIGIIVLWILLR